MKPTWFKISMRKLFIYELYVISKKMNFAVDAFL